MGFEDALKRLLWWWLLFGTLLWVIWRVPLGRRQERSKAGADGATSAPSSGDSTPGKSPSHGDRDR